jgi:hypothetical protein
MTGTQGIKYTLQQRLRYTYRFKNRRTELGNLVSFYGAGINNESNTTLNGVKIFNAESHPLLAVQNWLRH